MTSTSIRPRPQEKQQQQQHRPRPRHDHQECKASQQRESQNHIQHAATEEKEDDIAYEDSKKVQFYEPPFTNGYHFVSEREFKISSCKQRHTIKIVAYVKGKRKANFDQYLDRDHMDATNKKPKTAAVSPTTKAIIERASVLSYLKSTEI